MTSATAQRVDPRPPGDRLRSGATGLLAVASIGAIAIAGSVQYRWPVVVLLLIAPVVEEALFRAGVQEWLLHRAWRAWPANLASSVLFVAAHCLSRGVDLASLAVLLPSLALGWLYGRYRCLRLCIAVHMLMNIVWWSSASWAGGPAALP
jgi:membrane protease YdiL (CAAX protease family)